ncbi:outer membrane protein assembly factor BamD [Bacterioplanes sanyensis]|uniref:Outer membrane protein assembly factor BamD n=1 Tax=Bacterioplanes sanyensis TaxID=1249553 RepID=A0A222FIW3_9GAMM|nr:outer membrane protein assembly factor BamD [Bacterioplanes sanyensis]ASP38928.1 outer membrane protein assembly factor BamD [Bacterioplanes sanyensis]
MNARWLLFALALMLSACSNSPVKTDEKTERQYYQEAREALDNENFLVAMERLRQLDSRYPFGQYAEQGQLDMMYAHFMTADMESVLTASERFIRLHPLHSQVDYAYYLRALATYELGFSFVERYLSDDVARRDPTPMRDAFAHFSELLIRFPDSPYTADARARMEFLRQRLASYEVEVARYYMKRHAFIAAANRCQDVLLHYQNTAAVADALAVMVEAYDELGMSDEKANALALLQHNHPQHPQLNDGRFVSSGLAQADRGSLLNILSFGLLD